MTEQEVVAGFNKVLNPLTYYFSHRTAITSITSKLLLLKTFNKMLHLYPFLSCHVKYVLFHHNLQIQPIFIFIDAICFIPSSGVRIFLNAIKLSL
jgi:hypothetical protein